MNRQDLNNSKVRVEQGANIKAQTIKLGLDVHADTIVVVRLVDHSAPQPAQKFTPAKFSQWIKTQLAQAEKVYSCYEAGPFGFVLHRELVRLGVRNVVVQPVCLDEHHKGVNHDKSDAKELALRLDRYVSGNTHALATVRVPTPLEEQKRVASRQREQLKREVQRLAAQGRGLLLTQGQREKKGWWEARRWQTLHIKPAPLAGRAPGGVPRLLAALRAELDAATAALEAVLAPAARPKGLGGLTYEVVEREVGDWNRFVNRRQVGSYTGLCGGVSSSGNNHRLLADHQTRQCAFAHRAGRTGLHGWCSGNATANWSGKWWPVVGNPKASRAARKKAVVAIARQLAVDLWRWRTGRVKPW